MSTYKITYETSNGEVKYAWCEARNETDAECRAKEDFWDIDIILTVQKVR